MTSPVPSPPPTDEGCCGNGGSWSPKKDDPLAVSCMLCKESPTYIRNRPDAPAGETPLL